MKREQAAAVLGFVFLSVVCIGGSALTWILIHALWHWLGWFL